MNLYSIQKGKGKFVGNKYQPIVIQISTLIIGIILSLLLSSITLGFITILAFLFLNINLNTSLDVQSLRTYFLPQCTYDQNRINVIYGFAKGLKKCNSAYFGWRGLGNGMIEILACSYVNGKLIVKPLTKCKTQTWIFLNIQNKDRRYIFKSMTYNGNSMITSIQKGGSWTFYILFNLFILRLYPKLGNKKPADMDMKLYVKKLIVE